MDKPRIFYQKALRQWCCIPATEIIYDEKITQDMNRDAIRFVRMKRGIDGNYELTEEKEMPNFFSFIFDFIEILFLLFSTDRQEEKTHD